MLAQEGMWLAETNSLPEESTNKQCLTPPPPIIADVVGTVMDGVG